MNPESRPKNGQFAVMCGILAILIGLAVVFGGPKKPQMLIVEDLATSTVALVLSKGDLMLDIELADSLEERILGLSGRPGLKESEGLLFAFEAPGRHGIWMKDMKFSIDILWLNSDFDVVGIKAGAAPESYPYVFTPPADASYVLEAASGFAERFRISTGERLNIQKR